MLRAESLLVQSKRFLGKINIQRPRPPHYKRALFEAVTAPIYPKTRVIDDCREGKLKRKMEKEKEMVKETHPYHEILAKEIRGFFDDHSMVLVCHKNSIDAYNFFNFKVAMHKIDIKTKAYGRKLIRLAIENTRYQNLLPLFETDHCILFAPEPRIEEVLKILKKNPKIVLLAGVMNDRILDKNQLVNYSKLGDLQAQRAQFAANLYLAGNQVVNNLQSHQSNLCFLLDAHSKALSEGSTKTSTTNESTNTNPDDKKAE